MSAVIFVPYIFHRKLAKFQHLMQSFNGQVNVLQPNICGKILVHYYLVNIGGKINPCAWYAYYNNKFASNTPNFF